MEDVGSAAGAKISADKSFCASSAALAEDGSGEFDPLIAPCWKIPEEWRVGGLGSVFSPNTWDKNASNLFFHTNGKSVSIHRVACWENSIN